MAVTVEQIDQIAGGIRDALGANANVKAVNRARVILNSILGRLAETDLDVHKTALHAALGRLKSVVPVDIDPLDLTRDACDPLHIEFLLLIAPHTLKKFAHDVTREATRTTTTILGPLDLDDVPEELRDIVQALMADIRRRQQRRNQEQDDD